MGYYTEDEMFMVNNNMSRVVKKKYLARFKPIFLESAKQNCNFCKGYHLSCKTLS